MNGNWRAQVDPSTGVAIALEAARIAIEGLHAACRSWTPDKLQRRQIVDLDRRLNRDQLFCPRTLDRVEATIRTLHQASELEKVTEIIADEGCVSGSYAAQGYTPLGWVIYAACRNLIDLAEAIRAANDIMDAQLLVEELRSNRSLLD